MIICALYVYALCSYEFNLYGANAGEILNITGSTRNSKFRVRGIPNFEYAKFQISSTRNLEHYRQYSKFHAFKARII